METLRVFIAIDIEDPNILSRLIMLRDTIVSTNVPMKPVEDQNIHITLRFIGNVPRPLVDMITRDVLSKLRFNKFSIVLKGLGAFPNTSRPRVIWVGVEKGYEELKKIRDEIERGLRRLGIKPEKEEFVPHITLARIKGSRNISSLVKLLIEYADVEIGEMLVNSIRLKKSVLTPKGPIYTTLYEVKPVE